MKAFIEYSRPDAQFWHDYTVLWENSTGRPAFQAPHVLRYFAEKSPTLVAVYKFYVDRTLKGAALFHKKGGAYGFLSDMKTDHNSFVLHSACSPQEVQDFFECFHREMGREGWTIILNNQPMWAPYMDVFVRSGQKSGLFWLSSRSSVCPMVQCDTPQELYERLSKSRNNRYKMNRLQREHDVSFEALTGDEDLENWVGEFCDCHIERWSGTTTPSKYRDTERRDFLLQCLKAWHRDGILVRFAIKAGEKRIAFVIGLLQEGTLIYHNLTHAPEFSRHSPSLVLVVYLGEWLKERGFATLDFGDGNEAYKYNFANTEGQLNSIFIASRHKIPFIVRSKLISAVRSNSFLIQLYRQKLRPLSRLLFSA